MALSLKRSKIMRNMLAAATLIGLLAAVGFFQPVTLALNSIQWKIRPQPTSGDIVVVGIDSASISKIGRWPWPRNIQADLLNKLDDYNPKAVYVDIGYQGKTTTSEDQALNKAFRNMKAPTKVIALSRYGENGKITTTYSHPDIVGKTPDVNSYLPYRFGYVWGLPTTVNSRRGERQSVAASIAKLDGKAQQTFPINYNLDPNSIPQIAAKDVMVGRADRHILQGKIVVIGVTDVTQNDVHSMPSWGQRAGVLFHVLGAETLKQGFPKNIGWIPFFFFGCIVAIANLFNPGFRYSKLATWNGCLICLATSSALTIVHVSNDPLPSLILMTTIGIYAGRLKASLQRTMRNSETGLYDMVGYQSDDIVSNMYFVSAYIKTVDTVKVGILKSEQMQMMNEIGRRLSGVIDEQRLTHNEEQQFLWEMPQIGTAELSSHLEGLKNLFIEPIIVDGKRIDVNIYFGVDRNLTHSVKSRMQKATQTSIDAKNAGATFKISTTNSFEEHLAQNFGNEFSSALSNGDIAFLLEGQKSLINDEVVSAELSMCWTHPAHGQISTATMIDLARRSGTLYELSIRLYDEATKVSELLSAYKSGLRVSVKISIDVLAETSFHSDITRLMTTGKCRPESIVFEIIDIHGKQHNPRLLTAINELRKHGCGIAIGNFGLTNEDLQLLQPIKPDEICLPKEFARHIFGTVGNRTFIFAALRIADVAKITTVADGVEDREVLAELRRNGCREAKGKLIATPLSFNDFVQEHLKDRTRKTG
jgi:diguanylate cyclase